ncbi:sulfite exporter TauE/SafE family protein [Speluncibacter jeojiensis]|uniref:Probable membrane transporter protein n=1 Tax=Speluncibacter jeojiensis TaxID=2710754 RepID=A0A9X4RH18_9ACTN|nr:sulfite exporter TauE/SafE family protein [Rhodococcus sp. D2-41]MDG3014601.1 sulfite exporter TauE/SafE family protein [Corynebacteriales bacterium D3-21]
MTASTVSDTAVVTPADATVVEPAVAPTGRLRGFFDYRRTTMTLAVLLVLVPAIALFPGTSHEALTAGLKTGFTTTQLVTFLVVAMVAAAVKGLSGFGYALIATPLAAVLINPSVAVVVLAVPALMMNLFQVGETGTGLPYLRRHWPLIVAALVGSAIGVFILTRLPATPILGVVIGVLLVSYVIWSVVRKGKPATGTAHPAALGTVGVAEGVLLGAVNMGPLLPAYLHTFERDARRYIGGISLVFTLVFAERIGQMTVNGLMTRQLLWLGSVIALVTLVGLVAGTALRRWGRVNPAVFNAVVLTVLGATGVTMLVKALPHFL